MDIADNHCRRYSKRELINKAQQAGFQIEKTFYFNFLGVFGWLINGRLLNVSILPNKQLASYDKIIPCIKRFEQYIYMPFGQSIVLIARKSKNHQA